MSVPAAQLYAESGREAPPPVPPDWPLAEHSRIVQSFGTRWHVQQCGSGPSLLLLHGTAASTHSFRELIPLLARSFSIVAIDLPGHGFTTRLPDRQMSLPAISRGVAGLLGTLRLEPEYMVGHSAGAAISLRLALDSARAPDAVIGLNAALLPFGGFLRQFFTPLAQFFASTRLMPSMLARRACDRKAVERVIRGTGSVIDDEGIGYYQALLRNEAHVEAVLAMMAAWDLTGLIHDLPELEARLLLVSGGRDRAVKPGEATRVAAALEHASVIELADCGHLAHEEQPERVASIIEDFCLAGGEVRARD